MYAYPSAPIYIPSTSSMGIPPSYNPESENSNLYHSISPSQQHPLASSSFLAVTITLESRTMTIEGIDYLFQRKFKNGQPLLHKDSLMNADDRKLIYKGETSDGIPHGKGKFYNALGVRCIGIFSRHMQLTLGLFSLRTGSVFIGSFRNGVADGSGELQFANGNKFVGDFKNGIEHGFGEEHEKGFLKFKGHYRNGLRHGSGELNCADGCRYTGDYKNGMKHGYGIEKTADGTVYNGTFRNGLRNGHGMLTLPDGCVYTGQFKNGLKDGEGEEVLMNGRSYKGTFQNNIRLCSSWQRWTAPKKT